MGLALLNISGELIVEALHLPAGVELLDVQTSFEYPGAFVFKVSVPSLPEVGLGERIPTATAVVTVKRGLDPDKFSAKIELEKSAPA
jgi:hypothetical protein